MNSSISKGFHATNTWENWSKLNFLKEILVHLMVGVEFEVGPEAGPEVEPEVEPEVGGHGLLG